MNQMIDDLRDLFRKYLWLMFLVLLLVSCFITLNLAFPEGTVDTSTGPQPTEEIYPFILNMVFTGFSVGILVGVAVVISNLLFDNKKSLSHRNPLYSTHQYRTRKSDTISTTYRNPHYRARKVKVVVVVSKGSKVLEEPEMTPSSGSFGDIRPKAETTSCEKKIIKNPDKYDKYFYEDVVHPKTDKKITMRIRRGKTNPEMGIWIVNNRL